MLSTNYPLKLKALVVAGGVDGGDLLSSSLMLLTGSTNWTSLASLPRALGWLHGSIVGGKLRVIGGSDTRKGSPRPEVMMINLDF